MLADLRNAISARGRILRRIYWRPLVAVVGAVYAAVNLVSTAGGEFASARVQKIIRLGNLIPRLSAWAWAAIGVGLLLLLGVAGATREFRRLEGDHRSALEGQRAAYEVELAALVAAQPPPVEASESLQPRYHHGPMGEQDWITEHCVGVFNPSGQPARRVRMHLVRMDPYPRNVAREWTGPTIPYTVALKRNGDPNAGLTIGPGQEELWIIGFTATSSDGSMNAGGFSASDYRWRGLPWRFDPDERWRLSYEIVCDGRPDVDFSIVVTAKDGQLRCDLEG